MSTPFVRYQPVTIDSVRTQENQTLLLARAAERVWGAWCDRDGEVGIAFRDRLKEVLAQFAVKVLIERGDMPSMPAGKRDIEVLAAETAREFEGIVGFVEMFDDAVRSLYRVIYETDVYYSGYQVGRGESNV